MLQFTYWHQKFDYCKWVTVCLYEWSPKFHLWTPPSSNSALLTSAEKSCPSNKRGVQSSITHDSLVLLCKCLQVKICRPRCFYGIYALTLKNTYFEKNSNACGEALQPWPHVTSIFWQKQPNHHVTDSRGKIVSYHLKKICKSFMFTLNMSTPPFFAQFN